MLLRLFARKNHALTFSLFLILFAGGFIVLSLDVEESSVSAQGAIPAFPGAEGYGALALNSCDRTDIKVIKVTNTNSSGPGSLKDAIENQLRDGKLDVIIFRTGGTIVGGNSIKNSCVYIAGQTAPGDGIQLRGGKVLGTDRSGSGNNIVIRYLRLRSNKGTPGTSDVMSISAGYDIVLDHLSVQWGNDEVLSVTPALLRNNGTSPHDITLQRLIIAEGLRPHSTGSIIGDDDNEFSGPGAEEKPSTSRISIHHNIYAHNGHRNPRGSSDDVQVANNVIYNWKAGPSSTSRSSTWDFVSNTYTKGPWNEGEWIRHNACRGGKFGPYPVYPVTPSLYMEGNTFGPAGTPPAANQWDFIKLWGTCATLYTDKDPIPLAWRRTAPIPDAPVPVTIQSANDARTSLIVDADGGANKRLACDGSWVGAQDRVDSDIITHIQTGGGPATDEQADEPADYGGFPVLAKGTACTDSDGDGLPNAWESRYFSSTTLASITGDQDSDGYTNIEEYINGTDPGNAENLPPVGPSPPVGPPPPVPAGVSPPPPPGPGFIPPLPVVFPAVDLNFPNPLQVSSPGEFIEKLADLLFTLSLILAPVLLVISGIIFMSAAGNPQRVAIAKRMLLYTIIGFTVILLSRGLVSVVQGVLGG